MASGDLATGIAHLRNGDWAAAHDIAQADNSGNGAWLHAIVHMIERDEGNARYWFTRANRPFPGMSEKDVANELDALAEQLAKS